MYKDIFPFGAIEIIQVGEETGKSTVILKKLAEFYENEVIDMAELGMEAIRKIRVENFPAFIIVDDKGNDFFKQL